MERCALYNSLRMNYLLDPSLKVEPWQVEDYRRFDPEELFQKLQELDFSFDRQSFSALSLEFDSPEDFTDQLFAEQEPTVKEYDQVYLIVFELWRRLLPDQLCLSIFCDELDRQIFLHDQRHADNLEGIQNAIDNLQMAIEENVDEGSDPIQVFDTVCESCANDLESFLHDFIDEQIEHQNLTYASDLIEGFENFIHDSRWFDLLQARILSESDPLGANLIVKQLSDNADDLEFNLALLSFLVLEGDRETFSKIVNSTIGLLEVEEDFQELLTICAEFHRCSDRDEQEIYLRELLEKRSQHDLEKSLDKNDEGMRLFASTFNKN